MDALISLDDETLAVVLAIYRADIAEERARAGELHDNESNEQNDDLTAVEIYLNDLESQRLVARDARLAQSIVDAKLTDISAITEIAQQEQQARDDHYLARRLAYGENGAGPPVAHLDNESAPPSYEEAIQTASTPSLSKLAGLWVSEKAGLALHPDNKDHDPDPPTDLEGAVHAECGYCGDRKSYFEVTTVHCGCTYCRGCIRELFLEAFHDESLFPPRCCRGPISIDSIRIFLTGSIIEEYNEKMVEFSTKDKTYCSNPKCSKFIAPTNIDGRTATCKKCSQQTCTFCKNTTHEDECREDVNMQTLLNLAREEGWIRCGNCQSMIELKHGCYHMSCRCGHQFCYLCSRSPWKTCRCPQWDEDMLLDRSRQVAAREGRDVAEVQEELAERHNCDHTMWRTMPGEHKCDECEQTLPSFIYRCLRCRLELCKRCRRNRLR